MFFRKFYDNSFFHIRPEAGLAGIYHICNHRILILYFSSCLIIPIQTEKWKYATHCWRIGGELRFSNYFPMWVPLNNRCYTFTIWDSRIDVIFYCWNVCSNQPHNENVLYMLMMTYSWSSSSFQLKYIDIRF